MVLVWCGVEFAVIMEDSLYIEIKVLHDLSQFLFLPIPPNPPMRLTVFQIPRCGLLITRGFLPTRQSRLVQSVLNFNRSMSYELPSEARATCNEATRL